MTTQVLMPQLSPTMEEGKLVKWHVKVGDGVRSGDVVAEIETDKATMEVEAPDDGTIDKLLVAEGTEHVPVNYPIALLLTEDDSAAAGATSPQRGEVAAQSAAGEVGHTTIESISPSPQPSPHRGEGGIWSEAAKEQPSPQRAEGDERPDEGDQAEQVMSKIAEQIRRNGKDRIFASPLARRLARELGLELGSLNGSGPHGRIVKADVERAAHATMRPAERIEAPQVEPASIEGVAEPRRQEIVKRSEPPAAQGLSDRQVLALYEPGSYELVPHDTMRRFIAERLTLSKQTIPHFYLAIDCALDAALAARARLNALAPQEGPRAFKLSLNDFIIKALAMALQTVPAANATWTEEGLLRHRASDIAVAVALEGGGLHTPVIRDAEIKSLSEISNEMRDLAARARSKRLAPHEYQGGSTTISNLGMYGIDRFDAVINPPQASIMAVGRAEKRAVVKDDALKIATMMSVTLSVDHRVIDGALGAELLAAFKAYIEDPVTMLV
ncbi:MAG: pyruvate dehydrogenase complex dihydrolipoamide acetyltransferase [Methyloceanibacter sp.]|nr:pyruvate dehydrogenase complex dihydrolipoamide acetyltransferase [Methyloceanibacter sp.]